MTQFSRMLPLIGEEGLQKLNSAKVVVFGVGGVGGYVVEALVRAGVGRIGLVDGDRVSISNLNRQIIALHSTIGLLKAEVAKARAKDINPHIVVDVYPAFYKEGDDFDFAAYDYVVDAIDDVPAKVALIVAAKGAGVPVISCMGTGNKWDCTAFEVADIKKTSVCPLARVMRRKLKDKGVDEVKVVYSKEKPKKGLTDGEKVVPASLPFVPPVAGLLLASEAVKDLLK